MEISSKQNSTDNTLFDTDTIAQKIVSNSQPNMINIQDLNKRGGYGTLNRIQRLLKSSGFFGQKFGRCTLVHKY